LRCLARVSPRKIAWIDETGVDHRLRRLFGRSLRDEPIYEKISGSRRGRTSVLAALLQGKLVAPICFDGTCDSAIFENWLEKEFFPSQKKGTVAVLDNAAFHRKKQCQKIAKRFKCRLLFLPPYSPHLNDIEPMWAVLKAILKKDLPTAQDKFQTICNTVLMLC